MSYAALPILRTPRLTLRPLTKTDSDAVVAGIGNYDVSRWLGRVPYPYGSADYDEFFTRISKQEKPIWAILHEEELIGAVGLDEELGYWLARPHWGKGFGFEAAHAAVAHWFSDPGNGDLPSGHYDENDRSRRVLTALGFRPQGQSLRYAKSLAQPVQGTDMRLTRKDWKARQAFPLKTARLSMRPLDPKDAPHMQRLATLEVARNTGSFQPDWTLEEARAYIEARRWRGLPGFMLAVEQNGAFIGVVGCGANPPSAMYAFRPETWRQGIATEAMRAFLPALFARFPFNRLTADVFTDNPASTRVLEKLGFWETGSTTGQSKARLEPAPVITYEVTRDALKAKL